MGKGLVQDGLDALAHVAVDPTDEVDLTREYEQFVIGWGCYSRLRIIRILRISKNRLYDYELYEFYEFRDNKKKRGTVLKHRDTETQSFFL